MLAGSLPGRCLHPARTVGLQSTPVPPACIASISKSLPAAQSQSLHVDNEWQHEVFKPRASVRVAARKGRPPRSASQAVEDAEEEAGRKPRDQKTTAPVVLERGAPNHPYPGEFQQTLVSSFTLGGIGLHTGDYAVVRVRPAFAGEGRYFVRVPDGTNMPRIQEPPVAEVKLEEGGQAPLEPEMEEKKLELFKQYLIAQEDTGFDGTFPQWLHSIDADALITAYAEGKDVGAQEYKLAGPEDIQGRSPRDNVIEANLDSVKTPCSLTVTLGDCETRDDTIIGVELLLAALEAAGVDNARIEIEGGAEVPLLDGSALSWAMNIQFTGVRVAPAADGSDVPAPRDALKYTQPFTVQERDGSFVSFIPEDNMRLTAGVDEHHVSEVIGKQWKSWCLHEDLPFRFELGGARRYVPTLKHLQIYAEQGFYKGGTQGTVLLGFGDRWYEPQLVRYVHDEAARHEVTVLLGTLALLAKPGHSGLPFGHIIAYKATPELLITFCRELLSRSKPSDWVNAWDVPLSSDYPYGFYTDEELAEYEADYIEDGEGGDLDEAVDEGEGEEEESEQTRQ